ncbi:MAG: di-heme oxidoredictase family protein, partial [Myxococcota bacterium]
EQVGCDACHAPHFRTGTDPGYPHLSNQDIWPYTDLLLHDMGEALGDGRDDYLASGTEWRTAPLWGAGLARAMLEKVGFLHDGRARTVEEAVLWHGGEAEKSRDAFAALDEADRNALLSFLRSL